MKKVVELTVNLVMFLDYCVNITLMYILLLFFDGYVLQLKWSPTCSNDNSNFLFGVCMRGRETDVRVGYVICGD